MLRYHSIYLHSFLLVVVATIVGSSCNSFISAASAATTSLANRHSQVVPFNQVCDRIPPRRDLGLPLSTNANKNFDKFSPQAKKDDKHQEEMCPRLKKQREKYQKYQERIRRSRQQRSSTGGTIEFDKHDPFPTRKLSFAPFSTSNAQDLDPNQTAEPPERLIMSTGSTEELAFSDLQNDGKRPNVNQPISIEPKRSDQKTSAKIVPYLTLPELQEYNSRRLTQEQKEQKELMRKVICLCTCFGISMIVWGVYTSY